MTTPLPIGGALSGGFVALRRYAPGKPNVAVPVESADPFIDPNAIEIGLASQFVVTPWCTSNGWMCPSEHSAPETKRPPTRETAAIPNPEPAATLPPLGHSPDGRVTSEPAAEPIDLPRQGEAAPPAPKPASRVVRVSHRPSVKTAAPTTKRTPTWVEMPDVLKPTAKSW